MSMTAHPEASAAADVARIRSANYAGRDPDHLVTVEVDGDGVVVRVRLAATARTREPRVVERAVLAAVAAAQREIEQAWRAAASNWRMKDGVDGS